MRAPPILLLASVLSLAAAACAEGAGDGAPGDDPRPPGGIRTPPLQSSDCLPTGDGPHWAEELQEVSFTVRCATGLEDPEVRFELLAPPAGARIDEVTGEFRWTPGVDQAGVHLITIRDRGTGETGTVKVGVADAFDAPGNVPVDPTNYTEEYGLPVFHLDFPGDLSGDVYLPATVTCRGHTYRVLAKYRGQTSFNFPKRSYTLKFPDDDEFEDPLVGVGHRDTLVLITAFNDNSYVRTRLSFELWRLMDPGNIVVKTFHAVVYVQGQYRGVYTVSDRVDSDLMGRAGLRKAGNLYKTTTADANFRLTAHDGTPKASLSMGLEKKEGTPEEGQPGAFEDIEALTTFVATAPDADFRDQIGQWIHLPDYENWWIFTTLLFAPDSTAKNAYHYHDPLGGPFRYIPWDFDASLGQDWDTYRTSPEERYGFIDINELFRRMLAEPQIATPLRERYRALLEGPLAKDTVLTLFDSLQAQIRPAALRDERRWGGEYRSFWMWSARDDLLSYEEEAAYVRGWIDARWDGLLRDGVP